MIQDSELGDHALGRSRGGLSTKVHLAVDGRGLPLSIVLTGGQAGDNPQLLPVLDGIAVPGLISGVRGSARSMSSRTGPTHTRPPGRRCGAGASGTPSRRRPTSSSGVPPRAGVVVGHRRLRERPTSTATSSSDASTGSSSGGAWPPGMTSAPTTTAPDCSSPPWSSGPDRTDRHPSHKGSVCDTRSRARSQLNEALDTASMGTSNRMVAGLVLGAIWGALSSFTNADASPFGEAASLVVTAGWAWAGVAVVAGWLVGTSARAAASGVLALLAMTTPTTAWTASFAGTLLLCTGTRCAFGGSQVSSSGRSSA